MNKSSKKHEKQNTKRRILNTSNLNNIGSISECTHNVLTNVKELEIEDCLHAEGSERKNTKLLENKSINQEETKSQSKRTPTTGTILRSPPSNLKTADNAVLKDLLRDSNLYSLSEHKNYDQQTAPSSETPPIFPVDDDYISLSLHLQIRIKALKQSRLQGIPTMETITAAKRKSNSVDVRSHLLDVEPMAVFTNPVIAYTEYKSEIQMPLIMKIIQKDLSEPYSIYTYRYFIHNWPNLCFLAMCEDQCVGAIVCKLDIHRVVIKRGYIAMLAVDRRYRKHGIGSTLVRRAMQEMIAGDADEVVLETEITNRPALRLYEALGFVRDKRLFRYYLNGVDALRLKLWLR